MMVYEKFTSKLSFRIPQEICNVLLFLNSDQISDFSTYCLR